MHDPQPGAELAAPSLRRIGLGQPRGCTECTSRALPADEAARGGGGRSGSFLPERPGMGAPSRMHPARTALLLVALLAAGGVARAEPPAGMVVVPAGTFVMGAADGAYDEAPPHRVTLRAFAMDRTEVTVAAFAAYARESGAWATAEGPWVRHSVEGALDVVRLFEERYGGPSGSLAAGAVPEEARARWAAALAALRTATGLDGDAAAGFARSPRVAALIAAQARLPVRGVSWRDASAFARHGGKRLPTEAEWEHAARGAGGARYPWGDAWDVARVAPLPAAEPVAVGSVPGGASPDGCLDMAGNVWEWVADWYGPYEGDTGGPALDPKGPPGLPDGELPAADPAGSPLRDPRQGHETDTRKVLRGGGLGGPASRASFDLRATRRSWSNPSYGHPDAGFRCAKDLE